MNKRMVVDATHAEEIRVAIIQDHRLIDLDIETSTKEQIKGNIYLGKVTRVEPALQAAFVDFNGGRQGFLSVNDIHPKYYPDTDSKPSEPKRGRRRRGRSREAGESRTVAGETVTEVAPPPPEGADAPAADSPSASDPGSTLPGPAPWEDPMPGVAVAPVAPESTATLPEVGAEEPEEESPDGEEDEPGEGAEEEGGAEEDAGEDGPGEEDASDEAEDPEDPEDADEEVPVRMTRPHRRRNIPIQKILTRGQSILVQVIKEARGNKGASLTTNLSLAGRYTVLLPENSGGGGGISRKIVDSTERKNLKAVMATLDIPKDVSLIIRTAGLGRTKREINRDMNYLLRLWKKIQETSRNAQGPMLIHEEADLILRTIRDLYTTDMTEILIHGNEAYRRGKDYMRLLMPRYVKVVQPYRDPKPIFAHFQVEDQIESMHDRVISLKAGGYLVIESTEALVSIDINSGRATREKDVESTAFKTNSQAADEIARQLRLRDLGGLIVIDFIDMEDKKHNSEVEKRLKEAFKQDRAKIQLGRISQFGLLELSRQRLKPAFNESNRVVCPRCEGLGTIRSVESSALHLMRRIGEEASTGKFGRLVYQVSQEVANYILNNKRPELQEMEAQYQMTILILGSEKFQTPLFKREVAEKRSAAEAKLHQDRGRPRPGRDLEVPEEEDEEEDDTDIVEDDEDTPARAAPTTPAAEGGEGGKKRRRRRRRRRSGGQGEGEGNDSQPSGTDGSDAPAEDGLDGAVPTAIPGLYTLATPGETVATGADSSSPEDEDGPGPDEVTPPRRRRRRRRRSRSGDRGNRTEGAGTDGNPEGAAGQESDGGQNRAEAGPDEWDSEAPEPGNER
ncbi:MAG: Rne/Rng family ribonuclease [Magnetococcales bacterium]|nr:Rne/Rng family ribonuclease [Magnetococcales bacterium]